MSDRNQGMEFDWQYKTGVSMDDVGGMDDLKEQLNKEVIRPLTTDREKAEKLGITAPNILFHGPPGTGKTYIAKALSTELGLPFVKLSGSDVKSKWINQSAQQINQLFSEAEMQAKKEGGALIFLDELDSVLSNRSSSGQHEEDNKVVNEFLNHLEETKEHGVVFVGATNRLEQLDKAATRSGRIDRKIEVGLPDASARANILEAQLKQRAYKIATENIETIAQNAEDYSAADIEGLVQDAARNAAFERDADIITVEDIEAVDTALTAGTDTELSADKIVPETSKTPDKPSTKRTHQPQVFESTYRVVGFGDGAKRMALYDIPRDDTVWVNTIGYDEAIHSKLEEVQTGNVVEATVTDEGENNEYWNLLEFEILQDTLQYYIPTDGYSPGPIDEFWEKRADDSMHVTVSREDDDTGEILYEIQVQQKEFQGEDGKMVHVYKDIQRGDLLTEPLFEGNGCEFLKNGAEAILVVNPQTKPYVVFYLFPEKNAKFNDIWGALYDYVEN
ncbi:ATP-binding protein [Halohasta litorea]|uniref:ATP-binding protein n=1 Tax=Halohasta litorea TaxID=869891 RepID=A0ABD6D9D2_9EURY|nr:ATP-binding protein [Halohasta litorea]